MVVSRVGVVSEAVSLLLANDKGMLGTPTKGRPGSKNPELPSFRVFLFYSFSCSTCSPDVPRRCA